jgi:hypothetical protein
VPSVLRAAWPRRGQPMTWKGLTGREIKHG